MAPDQKVAVIILTNRSAMSLPKTAEAVLEMLLPFDSPRQAARQEPEALSEREMTELAGTYTNRRQTIELAVKEGELRIRRRAAEEAEATSGTVLKGSEGRLSVRSERTGANVGSYFVVRDAEGRAEYLVSGGRAYRRVEARQD